MRHQLEFKKYSRKFKRPIATSSGLWEFREGIILRLVDENGEVGFGEIAPLPSHGSETLESAYSFLEKWDLRDNIPVNFPCVALAVRQANLMLEQECSKSAKVETLPVCCLFDLQNGNDEDLMNKFRSGYRSFKVKIAVNDRVSEQKKIEEIFSYLPLGAKVRLDANGGLDLDSLRDWVAFLRAYLGKVEFLEQPLPANSWESIIDEQASSVVPFALDESLPFVPAELLHSIDCPVVLKMHNFQSLLLSLGSDVIREISHRIILSSSFETAIGLNGLLRDALDFGLSQYSLGIGVGDYFEKDVFAASSFGNSVSSDAVSKDEMNRLWEILG